MSVSAANADFWNTLCGTSAARSLGITERNPENLRKFDDWYFRYYPYLDKHIRFAELRGRRVLEVGLGYGSVGQRLMDAGAVYSGLDIAKGPVEMMNYRAGKEVARVGDILEAPFPDGAFDAVVAIGCYHHTANMQRAINESYRMLGRGGVLVLMVYNALSYRRRWGDGRKEAYDGEGTPHTDFVSVKQLEAMCGRFSSFSAHLENIEQEKPFSAFRREVLMRTALPRWVGLDIYARAMK